MNNRIARLIEFTILFIGLPLVLLYFKSRVLFLGTLWLTALFVYFYLKRKHKIDFLSEWNIPHLKQSLPFVLKRFAVLAPILAVLTYIDAPAQFLNFPLERPRIWVMVMILYPLLSVWPQELLFRSYIHYRYGDFLTSKLLYCTVSALAFGYAHIMLWNIPAVVLSAMGGALFAQTFKRNHSLAAACIEHALYGCLAFTLGLGRYLYSGAAWEN